MIARAVRWSGQHPRVVLALAVALALAGELARRQLPQDLLPELGEPQVPVVAEWPGHPAAEVTARLTRVLTGALAQLPGASVVRGSSMAGMSQVSVVLAEGADLHAAQAEISNRVASVRSLLPREARVRIGPEAGSAGWVYQLALIDPGHRLPPTELRRLQEAVVTPALASVPGVAEVAVAGGLTEKVVVDVDSAALSAAALPFEDVVSSVRGRLSGAPPALTELRDLPIRPSQGSGGGTLLGAVARVAVEHDMPTGLVDLQGGQPAVGTVVVVQRGADVPSVLARVRAAVGEIAARLPPGVQLLTVHDRSEVIAGVQRGLRSALTEEVLVVALVVLFFLLDPRAALIPVLGLPLVVLLTFLGMWLLDIPSTVMSLGGIGIALGLAVDAEVVALEACHRRLESAPGLSGPHRRAALLEVAQRVTPALVVSLLVSALGFLPVLSFSGETGQLVRPLALTKTLVLLSAALVAVTFGPVLRRWLLRGRVRPEGEHPVTRWLVAVYRPLLELALRRPGWTLATSLLLVLSGLPVAASLGGEFLPRFDEGDLLAMPTTGPGAPEAPLATQLRRLDASLAAFPEVERVFGKLGRAETATDPAPMSMAEVNLRLRPNEAWPPRPHPRALGSWLPGPLLDHFPGLGVSFRPDTRAELVARLAEASRMPGWSSAWTGPARARIDMASTGIRTPVGLRLRGPDAARLEVLAAAARTLLEEVEGTRSAFVEASGGERWIRFAFQDALLSARGVDRARAAEVASVVTRPGPVGVALADGHPLPVHLAQDGSRVGPLEQLAALTVRGSAPSGGQPLPLALLGTTGWERVPSSLHSEGEELAQYVQVDLTPSTNAVDYVRRADRVLRRAIAEGTLAPRAGERMDWIGQVPLIEAGERRLGWIVPAVLASMLLLLVLQLRSITEACIVLVSVPFALVGSVWTLYWLGYSWSAPVWVGLLSAAGLALQTAVVLVVYIDEAVERRLAEGSLRSEEDVRAAHAEGALQRLRPKVMTVATMVAGLLPLLWAEGTGAEITRRIAAPMLGGLLTSAFLTLEVLPVLYTLWRRRQLRRAERLGLDPGRVLYSRTVAAREGTPEVSTRNSM